MSSHSDRFRGRTGLLPPGFKFSGFQGLCMSGLDSSAYLSSAMGSPAVMVLTSTGADVVSHSHGQTTFARQRSEKDTGSTGSAMTSGAHLSFPNPPFPVRPIFGQGDPYTSLSSPLLSLHHPLLASHALGRSYLNAASGGAFRPLGMPEDRNGFHGSAFVPAKCMKLDSSPADLSSQHLLLPSCYPGSDGSFQSPANSHASTGSLHGGTGSTGSFLDGKEDDHRDSDSVVDGVDRMSETPNLSEESRSIERSTPEEGGTPKRHKKCFMDGQTPFCPICGQTLQIQELAAHFEMEVERLIDISKCIGQQMDSSAIRSPFSSPLHMGGRKDEKGKPQSRWETYQRVKNNRTSRLTTRCLIKRKKWEEPVSPSSSDRGPEEAHHLMGQALRKEQVMEPETSVDSRTTAEFNWALTTRLHAFAQLQRGLTEYNAARKFEAAAEDDNQELNVDGDDSATYGQPHYTEADVITCSTEDNQDNKDNVKSEPNDYQRLSDSAKWSSNSGESVQKALRKESSSTRKSPLLKPAGTNGEGPEVTSTCATSNETSGEFSSTETTPKATKENGSSSKEHPEDGIKCLICMEPFIKPVVSICCWHVHCEECWLKTLGTKKLCPQCNMITSVRDLRRIYL